MLKKPKIRLKNSKNGDSSVKNIVLVRHMPHDQFPEILENTNHCDVDLRKFFFTFHLTQNPDC